MSEGTKSNFYFQPGIYSHSNISTTKGNHKLRSRLYSKLTDHMQRCKRIFNLPWGAHYLLLTLLCRIRKRPQTKLTHVCCPILKTKQRSKDIFPAQGSQQISVTIFQNIHVSPLQGCISVCAVHSKFSDLFDHVT
jgi:hypothetical protein